MEHRSGHYRKTTAYNIIAFLPVTETIGKNDIQLCNFDQLRLTLANLTSLAYFPFTTSPKLWQDFLDEQIKIICKLSEFDEKLKEFFLDDLASNKVCNTVDSFAWSEHKLS